MKSWHQLFFCYSAVIGPVAAFGAATVEPTTAGDLAEIVVTAQRRAERLQDVPISITSLSTDQLTDANITDLASIMKLAPGVRFDAQGPFTQGTIRGVGSSVVTTGSGANVGIYIDGFFVPNPEAADQQLLNVNDIQVLKGPQGTLFGRNTTGGAILVNTLKPSQKTDAIVDVSYGSYHTQREMAYLTTGLTDKVAVDVSGMFTRSDNYFTNVATDSHTDGAYKNYLVRTGLKVNFSDSITELFRYEYQNVNDPTAEEANALVVNGQPITLQAVIPGAIVATRPGEVANPSPNPSVFTASNNILQNTLTFDFNFGTLTSLTQYRRERGLFGQNNIPGSLPILTATVPVQDNTKTQEFLLTSKPGSRLQWTAGAFYFDYTDLFRANISLQAAPLFQVAGSYTNTESFAGFFDTTYQVLDKLFMTAGLRYTHDEVKDGYYLVPFSTNRVDAPTLVGHKVTPRLVVRYTPTDDSSVYASFTQGYKAGIYNLGGNSLLPVRPENITAYEIGFKYAQKALAFDVSSFYYKYKDLQVPSYGLDANNVPVGFVSNAANSRIYGLEGDVRYELGGFEVNANASYLNAKYSSFPNAPGNTPCFTSPADCGAAFGTAPSTTVDASGFEMQRAPLFSASVGAKYTMPIARGRLAFSGNVYYTSSFFQDSGHEVEQPAYATLGLRTQWTSPSERYTVAVYVDNVTDRRFYLQAYPTNEGYPVTWSAPRMVFGEVKVRLP